MGGGGQTHGCPGHVVNVKHAFFTFTNRPMKNEWEEEIENYNYKYFGRSTEGEKVFP